mmetsp:Transcript_17222/g.46060  ORF Transcript_17222/g.46060 Transcript_17222/m.46060 type:complete len:464 (+) Transcript_17222:134-1525(+)
MGSGSSRTSTQGQADGEEQGDQSQPAESEGGMMDWASSIGVRQGYEELVNAIIRPPRMIYDPKSDLGPAEFSHWGARFMRSDIELENSRGLKLQCSWWKFHPEDTPAAQLPCVIYLHGNAACRIAAIELLQHLLPSAITVFSLDFSGSGLSGGEHVSLGYFEREDVETVIAYLRASGETSTIALWGHSMGATTALLYGDRDPTIAAMVLDSAFSDLMRLANELGQGAREQGLRVPGFAISMATSMIRRSVRQRARFDPQDVSPIGNCSKCFIPALFAHGEKDVFIKLHHSEELHEAYAGDKNLILFDGDHNSERPSFFFNSAIIFLRQTLQVQEQHCLDPSKAQVRRRMFDGGLTNMRRAEEEMMRQAMLLSIGAHGGAALADGGGADRRAPAEVQAPAPVPAEALRKGTADFEAVTGQGGATAQYYVQAALMSGDSVEGAIAHYFDSGCAAPPAGWQPGAAT